MEPAERHPFAASDAGTRTWASMTALSFVCHVVFFAMIYYMPDLRPEKKPSFPAVVNVTMVSVPEASSPKPAPARKTTKPAPAVRPSPEKPAAEKKPKPKEKVPARETKPIVKHSMKKQTYKSSKVVKSAISRIEKKVAEQPPEQTPDRLQKALDRLRKQVGEAEPAGKPQARPAQAGEKAGPGLVGDNTKGIRKELELIDIYRMEIAWRVQKNWAFPESLAGSKKDLVVELAFTVLPNGQIRDVWFDKRSGNRYLDESAKRAVLKSNPVGPYPEGITKSIITVGLRFTPEGVR